MTLEQYCLRWNDHRATLLSNFERLLENSTSVDCTLAAEGRFLRAHKVVLSACSPYFEILLNQDREKHPIIFMKDVKFQELKAIMQYMYRGEVVIPHDQLADLLHAAESLQIRGLGCGDKHTPETGNKSIPQPRQQLQLPKPEQQLTTQQQTMRQSSTNVRRSEHPKPNNEGAPQIVDLTDEKIPHNKKPVARHGQESVKRSMPPVPSKQKRVAYSPGTPERQIQIPSAVNFSLPTTKNTSPTPRIVNVSSLNQANPQDAFLAQNQSDLAYNIFPASNVQNVSLLRPVQETAGRNTEGMQVQKLLFLEKMEVKNSQNAIKPQIPNKSNSQVQKKSVISHSNIEHSSSPTAAQIQNIVLGANTALAEKPFSIYSVGSENPDIQQMKLNQLNANQSSEAKKIKPLENITQDSGSSTDPLQKSVLQTPKEPDIENPHHTKEPVKDNKLDKPGPSNVNTKTANAGRRGRPAGVRRYSCPECTKKFSAKVYLDKHLRIHDGDSYECDVCDKKFLTRSALVKHLRSHASKPVTPSQPPIQPQHVCHLCEGKFSSKAELEKHLNEHIVSREEADNK